MHESCTFGEKRRRNREKEVEEQKSCQERDMKRRQDFWTFLQFEGKIPSDHHSSCFLPSSSSSLYFLREDDPFTLLLSFFPLHSHITHSFSCFMCRCPLMFCRPLFLRAEKKIRERYRGKRKEVWLPLIRMNRLRVSCSSTLILCTYFSCFSLGLFHPLCYTSLFLSYRAYPVRRKRWSQDLEWRRGIEAEADEEKREAVA